MDTKKEKILATYRACITDEYKTEIGADWASEPKKVEAARQKLIKLVKQVSPNCSSIRHKDFLEIMIPAIPQTQYEEMSTQKTERPKVIKKARITLHADKHAHQKAKEIAQTLDKYTKNPYLKTINAVANIALSMLQARIDEIQNKEGLSQKEKDQMIKLLML